jgi:hypothetical protein
MIHWIKNSNVKESTLFYEDRLLQIDHLLLGNTELGHTLALYICWATLCTYPDNERGMDIFFVNIG